MIAYTLRLKAELRVNNAISTGFGMQHILLVKKLCVAHLRQPAIGLPYSCPHVSHIPSSYSFQSMGCISC